MKRGEEMQRCAARHPWMKTQCGLWVGHDGAHTVLIPSNLPWATHLAREEPTATPNAPTARGEGEERMLLAMEEYFRDAFLENELAFRRRGFSVERIQEQPIMRQLFNYEHACADIRAALLAARRENETAIAAILRDVNELDPTDYPEDDPETLRMSGRDLMGILRRHLAAAETR